MTSQSTRRFAFFFFINLFFLAILFARPDAPSAPKTQVTTSDAPAPTLDTSTSQQTQSHSTIADLPAAAQTLVSASLGRENDTFYFQPTENGYRATNASNTLKANFANGGMQLALDDSQWTFTLHGIGLGNALQSVSEVAANASANRLEYAHDNFTEWFVNGPNGLEQGWTIPSPLAPLPEGEGKILTLALALSGNAQMNAGENSIALLHQDGTIAVNYTGLTAYDAAGRELRAWIDSGDWNLEDRNLTTASNLQRPTFNLQPPIFKSTWTLPPRNIR